MKTEDFKTMLRRIPDSWLVCFCNETEMVGVFDLQLSSQDADSRSGRCAKLLPSSDDDLFSASYVFGTVSAKQVLRMLEGREDCWDADWTRATWTDLGPYGSALSFVGVPRVVERAWKETV